MEEFNEIVEFIIAHRDTGFEGHKIVDLFQEEFNDKLESKQGSMYFGVQLDGKYTIHVTCIDRVHGYKIGAMIDLEHEE